MVRTLSLTCVTGLVEIDGRVNDVDSTFRYGSDGALPLSLRLRSMPFVF